MQVIFLHKANYLINNILSPATGYNENIYTNTKFVKAIYNSDGISMFSKLILSWNVIMWDFQQLNVKGCFPSNRDVAF